MPCLKQYLFFACLLLLSGIFTGCEKKTTPKLVTEVVRVDSLEQIIPVSGPLVRPLLYTHVSGLDKLPGKTARDKFVAAILPSILVAKHHIEEIRNQLLLLRAKKTWEKSDSVFFMEMRTRYKGKSLEDMLARIGTLPNSIVLAQAAVESGWGQSRFFLEGNNLFGMWSFNRYEPRIAAGKTRGQKRIYLRSYMDISQSITHYFDILSKSWAYRGLRKARLETNDPQALLPHLKNFSERRGYYTRQLKKIIDANNFQQYDQYQIDPQYIVMD